MPRSALLVGRVLALEIKKPPVEAQVHSKENKSAVLTFACNPHGLTGGEGSRVVLA